MRPAEGTTLFFVDDQGVLFDEPAQRLYHLNTTSAYIWCLLEENESLNVVTAELAKTFGLRGNEAEDYLEKALGLFGDLRVLADSERVFPPKQAEKLPAVVTYDESLFVAERRYRVLSSTIRMRFSDVDQLRWVGPVLNHLTAYDHAIADVDVDIWQTESGEIVLLRDGRPTFLCDRLNRLAPFVKGLIWHTAVYRQDFFLDIHAGVVGDGHQAYLLPAKAGSGKSTLTAALVHAGFEFFSDELALLDNRMWVMPVPLSLSVKEPGTEVLTPYYPHLPGLALHERSDKKKVRYVPPRPETVPPLAIRRPVGAIVFPRYVEGCITLLEQLDKPAALKEFLAECLIVDTWLDRDKVASLVSWIEQVPSYRLTFSDLEKAVEAFQGVVGLMPPDCQ
jgi:hypothetical protein